MKDDIKERIIMSFDSSNIKLNFQERFILYYDILRKESKTWRKSHHYLWNFAYCFLINVNTYAVYQVLNGARLSNLRYRAFFVNEIKKSRGIKLFLGLFILNIAIIGFNQFFLPFLIYKFNYEDLTDQEMIELFLYVNKIK